MRDFLLDDTGDLVINSTSGDIELTDDSNTLLSQKIQSLLNTNFGELDWNQQYGLNQVEIMANSNHLDDIKQIIDAYLQDNLEGYASINIDSSEYDAESRNLSLVATVKMSNGQTVSTNIGGEY